MRAYSTDLREKIVSAYENGQGTLDEVADTFGVARRTVSRLLLRHRSGHGLAPKPHAGGYPSILNNELLTLLHDLVAQQPDTTLEELAADLKKKARVQIHVSTLCRALQKLGLPRKKKYGSSRAGRSRPPGFPSTGCATRPQEVRFYRRIGLSFGYDTPLRESSAWAASLCKQAAQKQARRATLV